MSNLEENPVSPSVSSEEPRGRWSMFDWLRQKEDKIYEQYADMLIEKLKSFEGNWEKPWLDTTVSWPKSIYGKSYNGMNALMLMMLCEEKGWKIPVFATFDRIERMNYEWKDGKVSRLTDAEGHPLPHLRVNKGEHGFPVFLTQMNYVHHETGEKISYPKFINLPKEERDQYDVYRNRKVFIVFNVDQTNMQEARPEMYENLGKNTVKPLSQGSEMFTFPAADFIVQNSMSLDEHMWCCPIINREMSSAYYSEGEDLINIPRKEYFYCGEEYYGTLFHEMAHSTGHKDLLNRLRPDDTFGTPGYAKEELVVELTSAIIAQRYGIAKYPDDKVVNNSVAYLNSWLSVLKEDPKFIRTLLGSVKDASAYITVRLDAAQALLREQQDKEEYAEHFEEELVVDDNGDVSVDVDETAGAAKKDNENLSASPAEQEPSYRKMGRH